MIFFRKRLLFWLVREYVKKWSRQILLFFVLGLIAFFLLLFFLPSIIIRIPIGQKTSIGMVGAYTLDSLPLPIRQELSRGLTKLEEDGRVVPDAAVSWKIGKEGKAYMFRLKSNVYFSDGDKLTTDDINYNFSDAKVILLDDNAMIFELGDTYAPFLVTVSRPVFKKNFAGIGEYKIKDIKLNGDFVQELTIISTKNKYNTKVYRFYPTSESLKTAFLLGEVSQAQNMSDVYHPKASFEDFPGITITKSVNHLKLVTIFYNTKDSQLSNRDIRSGLTYGLPDVFTQGERSYTPFPSSSWAHTTQSFYNHDQANAQLLTKSMREGSDSAELKITTLARYESTAQDVANAWKKIGINSQIEIVDSVTDVPRDFQVFIGDFSVSSDPDQYMLWHSAQEDNITRYENQRIDKLLEDGRKALDITERKRIYSDFQKYLLADAPASFLYFPYEYTIVRD